MIFEDEIQLIKHIKGGGADKCAILKKSGKSHI